MRGAKRTKQSILGLVGMDCVARNDDNLTPAPAPSAFPASAELAARRVLLRRPRVRRLAVLLVPHRPASAVPPPIAAPVRQRAWRPAALLRRRAAERPSASAPWAC